MLVWLTRYIHRTGSESSLSSLILAVWKLEKWCRTNGQLSQRGAIASVNVEGRTVSRNIKGGS